MKFDAAVIADLCIDILMRGNVTSIHGQAERLAEDCRMEVGGSAAILAAQFIHLGRQAGLFSLYGEDLLAATCARARQSSVCRPAICFFPSAAYTRGTADWHRPHMICKLEGSPGISLVVKKIGGQHENRYALALPRAARATRHDACKL